MSASGDRSKPASPRRLAAAIRAAHVPISHVLTSAAGLIVCLVLCATGAGWAVSQVVAFTRSTLAHVFAATAFDERVLATVREGLQVMLFLLGPVVGAAWALSSLVALLQSRGRMQLPGAQQQRHRPGRATPVIAVGAILATGAAVVWGQRSQILRIVRTDAGLFFTQAGSLTLQLLFSLGALLLVLGVVDVFWQRWRWQNSLRMSRAEVDQETRLTFGDPALRRERQRLAEVLLKKPNPGKPSNP